MKSIACACLVMLVLGSFMGCGPTGGDKTNTVDSLKPAAASTSDWKLGVQLWTFRVFTFTEAINKVDSAGIKNVEAFWGQPIGGGSKDSFGIKMSDATKAQIKAQLQSKGIQIVAMGVIAPGTKEEWVKAFQLAKEFNLSYITCEPRKEFWNLVDSLAVASGINAAIHDHPIPNAYSHPDSVLAAITGHPHIGSCADVGHWSRNGLNPVECLQKLQGHVFGVHLKDIKAFGVHNAEDTVVSKGVIDFPAIFKELKRQGFKGMLSIEHESNWYHSLPDVIATVKYYDEQVALLNKQ